MLNDLYLLLLLLVVVVVVVALFLSLVFYIFCTHDAESLTGNACIIHSK